MTKPEISSAELATGLRDFFDDYLGDYAAMGRLRQALDDPSVPDWDATEWRLLSGQLGAAAVAVPEDLGGLGLGVDAAARVSYEAGAWLYSGPLRSCLHSSFALAWAGRTTAVAQWLREIAAGQLTVTTTFSNQASQLRLTDGTLSGTVEAVADAASADLLVFTVQDRHLVAVPRESPGVRIVPRRGTDSSHRYADIVLTDVAGAVLDIEPARMADLDDIGQILLAAEQAGGTAGCLKHAAAYACLRTQFGAAIATFQAVGHRCADLAVDLEGLRGVVHAAACAADRRDRHRLRPLALLARAAASDVFAAAADTLIHVHGGTGFTWEHDAHLYFRRAHSLRHWCGSPGELRHRAIQKHAIDLITT